MRGFLIALSGIDGCGKTTQAARLVEWLRSRDPGAQQVKARLTALQGVFALAEELYGDPHDYHPQIPATLREFTIAADLVGWSRETLVPLLATGVPVVWDRSPLCYEAYARCYGADMTWPSQLLKLVEQPDVIFLLDLAPEEAIARLRARTEQPHQTDEDLVLLTEARETYLTLAGDRDNVITLDAARGADRVTEELIMRTDSLLRSEPDKR